MKSDIKNLLEKGVSEVIVKEHLENELAAGKKLRVKFGVDPTSPNLHLGHSVPLRKLRQFQDAGHTAVLIIGDYTARIGDPTGRSEERKPLSEENVKENMKEYLAQAGKIIDIKKTEVRYNSEWFYSTEGLSPVLEAARAGTFQQVMHRADFKKRIDEGHDITVLEILYPLLQGYDSVKVAADVELGGTDQTFNLLMGRRVQRHFKMKEQDVVVLPLLVGLDGVNKMSKSAGNYIGLTEEPNVMFGKIMSVPDALVSSYYELCVDEKISTDDPREAKLELGKIIVDMYHGPGAGQAARDEFIRVFSKKGKPSEIELVKVGAESLPLAALLVTVKLAKSKSEARRLIEQGGVKLDDEKQNDPASEIDLSKERLIQVGPKKFLKVSK